MSRSLQEQLVQAGLAEQEQAKRRRKQSARGKPRQQDRRSGGRRAQGASARTPASHEHSAPTTEETAAKRAERIRQIVQSARLERAYADVPYRFTQAGRVRELAVTNTQQARIARGELAVVHTGERFELVPAKTARRVRGIEAEAVVVLHEGESRSEEADHPVPDHLQW